MPTNKEDVKRFFERLTALEVQVSSLMVWHKWQMTVLGLILAAVIASKWTGR